MWFTLFEIFFLSKNSTLINDFPRKLSIFLGWKSCENVVVLDFLAVDIFDFTRKIVKKIWVKNLWKCLGFVKIEFLDKNLTFRIVCSIFFVFAVFATFLCVYAISVFLYHFFVLRNFFAFYAFRVLRYYARFPLLTLTYYAFFHFFSIWIFAPKVYL